MEFTLSLNAYHLVLIQSVYLAVFYFFARIVAVSAWTIYKREKYALRGGLRYFKGRSLLAELFC